MTWILTQPALPGAKTPAEPPDRQSVSSRVKDCDSFAWAPGMLAAEVPLGEDWPTGQIIRQKAFEVESRIGEGYEMMPVLGDPATRGALLDLVRRCGYPFAYAMPQDGSWVVRAPHSDREILARAENEGAALARALIVADTIAKLKKGGVVNEKG